MNKNSTDKFNQTKFMSKVNSNKISIEKNNDIVKKQIFGIKNNRYRYFLIVTLVLFIFIGGILSGFKIANYCQYQWQSLENSFLHQQYTWQQQENDLQTQKDKFKAIKKQLQQETENLLEKKNQPVPKESLLNNIWNAITGKNKKNSQKEQAEKQDINTRLLQIQENIKNIDKEIDKLNQEENKLDKLKREIEKKYQENSTLIGYFRQFFL
ncbi:hypothetical protein [Pectinatus brassicae]|uniref:Chromosome segregation ATPase n=1 Tax=Pectinatus brassicae TaxID=862415 RepID=A0A840UCG8_9FIRM|nr:hypothetical protein [Pectinatus brassicae]MBB5335421.1 chromosome segregation ATPase [Pectinatus brassicae]